MPAKSGASHGLSAFTAIILSAFLSNYLSAHSGILWSLTSRAGAAVVALTGVPLSQRMSGMLGIATLLSFAWGVAYHAARH